MLGFGEVGELLSPGTTMLIFCALGVCSFSPSLLPCACVYVRACARACVRACVRASVRPSVRPSVRVTVSLRARARVCVGVGTQVLFSLLLPDCRRMVAPREAKALDTGA